MYRYKCCGLQINSIVFSTLDELRVRGRGNRVLYAKREYKDGRTRPLRLKLDGAVDLHAERAINKAINDGVPASGAANRHPPVVPKS